MGDTFLRNFVTTFDFKNSEMRLTINKNAPAGVKIEFKMGGWRIFGIIVACLVGVICLVWLVTCCCKKYRKHKQAKETARGYAIISAGATLHEGEISSEPLH